MKTRSLLFASVFLFSEPSQARPWTDLTHRTIEVAAWRVEGETVYFQINGKEIPTPLNKLSPEDQAFARKWAAEHPAPSEGPTKPDAPKPSPTESAKGNARSHLDKLPNGDVIIRDLPVIAMDREINNQLYVTPALTLEKLYHWPTDLLSLAKKMGWDPKKDSFDEGKFYEAAAKEARVRTQFSAKFDFETAIRHLNKGEPIIVWRCWAEARDQELIAFSKELKTHADAKLPAPRDAAERKKWPTDHSNSNGMTSMIMGYNRQRGEVMLHIPNWGEDYTGFRMRKEEMEVSAYGLWYFEAK